jgi:Kef-type K+ transport system membrane component KefB/Trk K+ transport system NAD-binding subunit
MAESFDLTPLLIVAGLAFVVPLLLARLPAIPIVVGEIFAGILIGRSGFGLVEHEDLTLLVLSDIGFAFLMFLSGLEIDFSAITRPRVAPGERNGPHPLWLVAGNFAATLMLAVPIGFLLVGQDLARDPWMMALILSTTSLGIVVPVLKEKGMSSGRFGQLVLLAALVADFATMLLITVYVLFYSSGLGVEIMLMGVLFLAFLLTYQVGVKQMRRPVVRRFIEGLEKATSQFKVRGSIALMLAFVVLAELVDVELILGAFLAGAQVSLLSTRDDEGLREKLDAIGYGFFIPVFFIMVGIDFNLPLLLENPTALLLAPLLLVVAILIKLIAAIAFKPAFSWREVLAAGWLLSARLSLIIAAAAIGLRIGVIGEATNAAIILVAAVTATAAPLVSNALLPKPEETEKRRYLIFGAANLALQVAQELRKHGERVLFLEPEQRLVKLVREEDFEVIQGEGTEACLRKAQVMDVETLLVLSGDDDRNYRVCQTALRMGAPRTVALVNEPTRLAEFRELGVRAVSPTMLRPIVLASMARNPDLFTLLTSTSDDRDVREVFMNNPIFKGRRIGTVVFPGDSLVLTIRRDGEVRIPHGSTPLELGDRLSVLGERDSLDAVQRLLEG